MTDKEDSSDDENEQTGGGHRQTEMDNESGEDDNSDNESEPDYGGPKCSECGRSKMWDWSSLRQMVKMKNLKVEMTNLKHLMNMTHNLIWLMWKRRMYMRKIKYGRQFKS